MSIFSLFGKKATSEHVLIVDVASSAVTSAYVDLSSSMSKIVASTSAEIAIHSDLSFSRFENEMLRALSKSLSDLFVQKKVSPKRIQVYFASPWYASQVRVVRLSRPKSFVVTSAMLNDLITRELKSFEEEEIKAKVISPSEAIRVIESNTMQVKLNGYVHDSPVNAMAHDLEMSIFLSVAQEQLLEKVEKVLAHSYGRTPVKFSSFISSSFIVSRDYFPHQESYLLVDIGGEVTEVTFVKNGSMVQSESFPEGRNFMLRRLSIELKRSIAESITICALYLENKVEDSMKKKCDEVLGEAKKEWIKSFQKVLFSVSSELSLPDTILLTVDKDVAPWFVDAIKNEEFHEYALTERDFKIIELDASFFHSALLFEGNVARNPFIMIDVLASLRKNKV